MPVKGTAALLDALMRDEGSNIVAGVHRMYKCPADKWTLGYGHNIQDNGIPDVIARALLEWDADCAQRDAMALVPNWPTLDAVRRNVVSNMAFNMGKAKLAGFKKFLAAVNEGRYEDAANEMEDSLWYKQVGNRSKRLAAEMLTGVV